jgi:hypothetical protein
MGMVGSEIGSLDIGTDGEELDVTLDEKWKDDDMEVSS